MRRCSRPMSLGDLGRNFDSVLTMGAGPVATTSDVAGVAAVRDDTDRITSLNRLLPADWRSSTADVTMPVTIATHAKTPMTARMSVGSMGQYSMSTSLRMISVPVTCSTRAPTII